MYADVARIFLILTSSTLTSKKQRGCLTLAEMLTLETSRIPRMKNPTRPIFET